MIKRRKGLIALLREREEGEKEGKPLYIQVVARTRHPQSLHFSDRIALPEKRKKNYGLPPTTNRDARNSQGTTSHSELEIM